MVFSLSARLSKHALSSVSLFRQASSSVYTQATTPYPPTDPSTTRPDGENSPSSFDPKTNVRNSTDGLTVDDVPTVDMDAFEEFDDFEELEQGEIPEWQARREGKIQDREIYKSMRNLGSFQTDSTWHPTHSLTKPITAYEATLSHLVAAGTHMGHHPSLSLKSYRPYLAGRRSGMDIINLEHTLPSLRKACGVMRDIARDDGVVVFVGRKKITKGAVVKAVEKMPGIAHAVTERWRPGTLTNAHSIFGAEAVISGAYLPDLIVVLDPRNMVHIINEANNKNIPTMGLVDTDVDPRLVTFPIFTNVDSARSLELILGALGRAGGDGIKERQGALPGSRFLLPQHRFQAKIDKKREFDNIEQPIDWDA